MSQEFAGRETIDIEEELFTRRVTFFGDFLSPEEKSLVVGLIAGMHYTEIGEDLGVGFRKVESMMKSLRGKVRRAGGALPDDRYELVGVLDQWGQIEIETVNKF